MFFIGLPILSYLIRPHATTIILYTKLYADHNTLWVKHASHQKTRVFKSRLSLKVKQHGQKKLYLQ